EAGRRDRAGQSCRRGSGIAARPGAMVCAGGTQAWLAYRVLLGALRALGQALARNAAGRAAGDAAVRALLADPLLQGRRNERRARGETGRARRGLTLPVRRKQCL